MKKILIIFSSCILASCMQSSAGVALYNNATEGMIAYNNVAITKTGEACSKNYLGLIAIGNNSIEEAKSDGNITNIATVDTEFKNILGIYQHACTIIRGN